MGIPLFRLRDAKMRPMFPACDMQLGEALAGIEVIIGWADEANYINPGDDLPRHELPGDTSS